MGLAQFLRRSVQQHGHGPAVATDAESRSFLELGDRVARLAAGLQSIGVASGDRVAILALNSARYYESYVAIPWAGAVVVPLNTRWSTAEIAYALNDSGATVLLIDDAFTHMYSDIAAAAHYIRRIISMGNNTYPAGVASYEELIARSGPAPDAGRTGEDMAGVFYTGGTTGSPKGVMLSHRGVWASACASQLSNSAAPLTRESIYLHAAPMFHVADFGMTVGTLVVGAQSVFLPSFTAEGLLAAIERHRVTHVVLVPTMVRMMLASPTFKATDLSSLRLLVYGAAPMPEDLLRQTMRELPAVKLAQGYGQTETSPVITSLPPEYHVFDGPLSGKLSSAGRAIACCEVEIVGPDDCELPRGTVGELRTRGLNAMLGYWNKPDETARTMRAGWIYTGDAGRMDDDGFVFLVDRMKDMIVSGGENVYSAEVENACMMHPAVAECVVIGIPHDGWGEAVHALVILRPGKPLSDAELLDHCHGLIAGYKCPQSISYRTEPFPLSAVGKVLKHELRKPYWDGRSRRIN